MIGITRRPVFRIFFCRVDMLYAALYSKHRLTGLQGPETKLTVLCSNKFNNALSLSARVESGIPNVDPDRAWQTLFGCIKAWQALSLIGT